MVANGAALIESLAHEILAPDLARMAADFDALAVKAQVKLP